MASTEMEQLVADFIERRTWAVVGASQDRRKYGNQILTSLRQAGYHVYPVNPRGGEIDGMAVYTSLSDLPQPVDVVDIVVPPSVTEQVVREAHELGLQRIWMQPGAESEKAIAYCQENGMEVVHDVCAMLRRRQWD